MRGQLGCLVDNTESVVASDQGMSERQDTARGPLHFSRLF
jgi:hypothetical protein